MANTEAIHGRGIVETDCAGQTRGSQILTQTARVESARPQQSPEAEALRKRLATYSKWTSQKSSLQLATAGFIYTGVSDKVECQSCGIRLYNWQEEEDPLQAHKKYAKDCEFMIKNFPNVKPPTQPKTTQKIKYPQYVDYEARLKSFESWPLKKVVAQRPEMMARSGFFYIGSADRARCFNCGVTLRDWDTDDYPPCAHKQWSEHCPFVQKLNVDEMREEIEEAERQEAMKRIYESSSFIDCSSSKARGVSTPSTLCEQSSQEIQVDCPDTGEQVYSQVTDTSTDDFAMNPSVMAVVEMGYSHDMIRKALDKRRSEGVESPNAVQLFETIMDIEG